MTDKHCEPPHFYKLDVWYAIHLTFSKVTVEDNDKTIYTKIYKGSGNEIKNSKFLTVMNTKGNS